MRILFIYPDICPGNRYEFHPGIGYISAVLKNWHHKTFLIHLRNEISEKVILKMVRQTRPDLIAFSSTTPQHPYVELYANFIKKVLDVPIICGGIHTTLCPNEVFSCKDIDIICIGEGEYPMLDLANYLEIGKNINEIPNLWIKAGNKQIKNPIRPLISNLDELPFPDRDLFNYRCVIRKNKGISSFLAGRGCPFDCTYCCNHAIKRIYKGMGPYVRIRSVENVLDEIGFVTQKYKSLVKRLRFDDDTFTIFPKWIKKFCEKYPKEFDYPFSCNVRATTINKKILLMLKKAGCQMIVMGIESGNEYFRKNILKRFETNNQIIRVAKVAHEIGLEVGTFNMIGFPFETKSMIEETLQLNRLIKPEYIQCTIFYPYPNTELWRICRRNNLLTDRHKRSYFEEGTTLNLPKLSNEDIRNYYIKFKELAENSFLRIHYPVIWRIYKILRTFLGSKITSELYDKLSVDPLLNSLFHLAIKLSHIGRN